MSRSKPSKRELELSEQAKRKVVEQYGLDVEDYEDLMRMGPPPPGGRMTFDGIPDIIGQATYRRSSPAEDAKLREWNNRLSELQARKRKRDEERKRTEEERVRRQADDFAATIRGEETPTQKEARQRAEAAVSPVSQPVQAQTVAPVAQVTLPAGPASGSGDRQGSRPLQRRNIYGGVGTDTNKRSTLEVNGMRLAPSTENRNLVNELQRRQLLDAPTGVDVTSPLYTNAEVRLMRRQAAQDRMFRDRQARLQKVWDDSVTRSNQTAWANGALRNADDWKHYGEVENTGGDGWKKGGEDYNNARTALVEKMRSLSKLADRGLLHGNETVTVTDWKGETYERDGRNPYKTALSLGKMIRDSDRGAGLSQKQFEVANAQIDRLMEVAQSRQKIRDRRDQYRADEIRRRLPVETANATTNEQVFAAEKAYNAGRRISALKALSSPGVWDTPELYDYLNVINSTSTGSPAGANGVGRVNDIQAAFREAMKDPAMNEAYTSRARALGGKPGSEYDIEDLQNRIGVIYMQGKAGIKPVSYDRPVADLEKAVWARDDRGIVERTIDSMFPGTVPFRPAPDAGALAPVIRTPQTAPQQAPRRIEDELLPVMATQGAGDALRPRRKGVV